MRFCSDTCRKRDNRRSQTIQISRDERNKTIDLETQFKVRAVLVPEISVQPASSEGLTGLMREQTTQVRKHIGGH
jgi:hypothetical protein